jgi:lipopolysaccharide biosynthesis regulator YciM
MSEYTLIIALLSLLAGLVIGKTWERYKLRDGRWSDRRRLRDTPHYVLGLSLLADNRIDEAIDELTKAAQLDANAFELQILLGNLYRRKGQVARAISTHQSLLQRTTLTSAEHAYCLSCLGLDFRQGGFTDRAIEAFREAVRLDPHNADALVNLQKLQQEQQQAVEAAQVHAQIARAESERDAGHQQISRD